MLAFLNSLKDQTIDLYFCSQWTLSPNFPPVILYNWCNIIVINKEINVMRLKVSFNTNEKIQKQTFSLWKEGLPEVGMFCAGVTVLTAVAPPNTGAPWGPLPGFWTIWGAGASCRLCSEGEVTAATVIEFPTNKRMWYFRTVIRGT